MENSQVDESEPSNDANKPTSGTIFAPEERELHKKETRVHNSLGSLLAGISSGSVSSSVSLSNNTEKTEKPKQDQSKSEEASNLKRNFEHPCNNGSNRPVEGQSDENSNKKHRVEDSFKNENEFTSWDDVSWGDVRQLDEELDKDWLSFEHGKLDRQYGSGIITVKFTENGNWGYFCKLCFATMNAKIPLEAHCSGMKHLKKMDIYEKENGKGRQKSDEIPRRPRERSDSSGPERSTRKTFSRYARDVSPVRDRYPSYKDSKGGSRERDRYSFPKDSRDGSRERDRYSLPKDSRDGSRERDRYSFPKDSRDGSRERDRYPYPKDSKGGSRERDRYPFPKDSRDGSRERDRYPFPKDSRDGSSERDRHPYSRDSREGTRETAPYPYSIDSKDDLYGRGITHEEHQLRIDAVPRRACLDAEPIRPGLDVEPRWSFADYERELLSRGKDKYDDQLRLPDRPYQSDYMLPKAPSPPPVKPAPPPPPLATNSLPPEIVSSLSGSPASVLLTKLAQCSVKTENDADLASNVINLLLRSLKDYNQRLGEKSVADLMEQAEIKLGTAKAIKSIKKPVVLDPLEALTRASSSNPLNAITLAMDTLRRANAERMGDRF